MNVNDFQIARISRRYLEDSLLSLAPDEAPTPFMVAGGPHGMQHVGLHCLTDSDFGETARTAIPAFILLGEAVEVALAAFVDGCAVIAHWGPRGRDVFTSVVMRRNAHPPVLGEWLTGPPPTALGPIEDAVRSGLDMTYRIWNSDADDLRHTIDAIRRAAAASDTDVLPLTMDALRECDWLS